MPEERLPIPSHLAHHDRLHRIRFVIISLRLGALTVMILAVWSLWRLMLWLTWQADCALAVAAVLAFAYKFERNGGR
jgi:hypothetical protein